jgi:hypothetical protein
VAMARRAGDADALVSALSIAALFNRSPGDDEACIAAADEVIEMAGRGADLAAIFWARVARLRELLEAGRIEAVDRELEQLERLGADSRRTYYRWSVLVLQAARAIFAGRLADGARLAEEAIALNRRHGEDAEQEYTVQRLALAMLGGRPQDAPIDALREYAGRYPQLPVWEAMLARAELGLRHDAARRSLERARDGFAALMGSEEWLCGAALLAEPAAALGTAEQIERLAAALAPHAERNVVMDDAWAAFGPVARSLGILASAAGRPDEAGRHFAAAVELCVAWGAAGWELAAIRDWLRIGAPGGSPQTLRARALALARDFERPWLAAELGHTTTP